MTTLDLTDTKRALAHHVSGDEYIVEYASEWDSANCVSARIVAVAGPVSRRDLGIEDSEAPSSAILADADLSDEDAAWLQDEEDAGRVSYPFGAV